MMLIDKHVSKRQVDFTVNDFEGRLKEFVNE